MAGTGIFFVMDHLDEAGKAIRCYPCEKTNPTITNKPTNCFMSVVQYACCVI